MNRMSILSAIVFGASVGLAPAWGQDSATPSTGETATEQNGGTSAHGTTPDGGAPADGMTPGAEGTTPGINGGGDGTDGASTGTDDTTGGTTGADGATTGTDGVTGADDAMPGAAGPDGSPSGVEATSGTEGAPDALDPFAGTNIDIEAAGTSVDDAQAFFEGLESEQQEEVQRRCAGAMGSTPEQAAVNEATTFCANLGEAGLLEEGTPTPQ